MKIHYKHYKLRDLEKNKGDLVSGPFGSNISAKYFVEKGIPVIRGNNLKSSTKPFIDDGFVFITSEKAVELRKCKAIKDDLIFTAVGTIGQVGIIPPNTQYDYYIISNKQIRLRVNRDIADAYFVYYQLSSKSIRKYLEGQNRGSSVPLLNLAEIRNVSILLPPIIIQRKITSILSAYDELIENNNQRIKLLEEMAEEIYKEWFVRMRFPGYESTRFFDEDGKVVPHGTVGVLPDGWEKVILSEVYITSSGGTPLREKDEFYIGGNINWVKTKELLDSFVFSTEEKITELGLKKSSAKIFPKETILIGMYGGVHGEGRKSTLGQLGILSEPSSTNQACCAFISRNSGTYSYPYLFHFLKSKRIDYLNMSMGAAQQNISQDIIKNSTYINPSDKIVKQFDIIEKPIFEKIKVFLQKNQLLQQTRDLLLPRLISGKLSVEHLLDENVENLSMAAEPEAGYNGQY